MTENDIKILDSLPPTKRRRRIRNEDPHDPTLPDTLFAPLQRGQRGPNKTPVSKHVVTPQESARAYADNQKVETDYAKLRRDRYRYIAQKYNWRYLKIARERGIKSC